MIDLNLQLFGGRGAGSGSPKDDMGGGGGGNNSSYEKGPSIVEYGRENPKTADEIVNAIERVRDNYPEAIETVNDVFIAKNLSEKTTMAFYGDDGLGINQAYAGKMGRAQAACAASGFHPKLGGKSGMEAVVSHELGHALTQKAANAMGLKGMSGLDEAAKRIVNEAAKGAGKGSLKEWCGKISGYAKSTHAEAVAEAFCDVHCNGENAHANSHAIVNTLNKYIRK